MIGGFTKVVKRASRVLGMNQRNLWFIYPNNQRSDYLLADNKLNTKELLAKAGLPIPKTYFTYSYFHELARFESELGSLSEFVIKPAMGSGGGGIIVVAGKTPEGWHTISGRLLSPEEIKKHLANIIFGVYSFDLKDNVIIEERVEQHKDMQALSPMGLADVRVILYRDEPVMAMSRIPTLGSQGRANLHQGALGLGINMDTGRTVNAIHKRQVITSHPDTGQSLVEISIPCWRDIIETARRAARALPLKYIGMDVVVSTNGPLILEANVRPGLEIQNANLTGLRERVAMLGL